MVHHLCRSDSGRWEEGGIVMNQNGLIIKGDVFSNKQGNRTPEQQPTEQRFGEILLKDLEMNEVIGRGSTGFVQKAYHPASKRFIALKVIALDSQEQARKQIVVELKTLIQCRSPYIVEIISAFYVDASVYIVLEYMDGTLSDIVKGATRIPEHVLARVAIQVLYGLRYLHTELKMIHRDIKPSNLLINYQGNVKISDFSVSGELQNSIARLASFVGTVTYMSPDRIIGNPYSFETDIWSFGLTLMECANGFFPYASQGSQSSFFDLMDQIVDSDPPSLPSDKFSKEFRDFTSSCLQKDPQNRAKIPQLMNHPFITHQYAPLDLGLWFREALKTASAESKS
eukprot:TRINITY_DN8557_c0_g1_i4.p1 TRINITY_DN8557_c0_g1~~TRINITY_DN8557_c0_g1_i4.p1  ORF type:complete len:341 (-),score=47.65 TRINITY_DN8557_c0_g1_i4:410-1432(-)